MLSSAPCSQKTAAAASSVPDELLDVGFVLEVALERTTSSTPSRRCAARPIEPSSFSVAV